MREWQGGIAKRKAILVKVTGQSSDQAELQLILTLTEQVCQGGAEQATSGKAWMGSVPWDTFALETLTMHCLQI